MMRRHVVMLCALLGWLAACQTEAPPSTDVYLQASAFIVAPGDGVTSAEDLEAETVAFVQSAREELLVALEDFESTTVAEALIAAHVAGVDVKVVGDEDRRGQAGFALVEAAGVPVVFGDGALPWNPNPFLSMERIGETNRMTLNVLVADRLDVLALSGGFPAADAPSYQLGIRLHGEDLARDVADVHDQLFGGTFATTLTFYGATTSADANHRTIYPLPDPRQLEMFFGPQEPAAKHIIDEIYAARSSVWVATEFMSNEAIVDALRYKAEAGFDVRVVSGAAAPTADDEVLPELIAALRGTGALVRTLDGVQGTLVLIDTLPSSFDGETFPARMFVSSAPLVGAVPFAGSGDDVRPRTSAVFTDMMVWMLGEQSGVRPEEIDDAARRFNDLVAIGGIP